MLNRYLYTDLCSRFGKVKVFNDGLRAQKLSRVKKTKSIKGGEYYAVCCPACRDSRHRLWISYLWGTKDEDGQPLDYLCHCFNESCEQSGLLNLKDELQSYLSKVTKGKRVIDESQANDVRKLMESPGECVLLQDLKLTHPACVFFQKRNFDPYFLSKQYSVSVCVNPDPKLSSGLQLMLWNRIIIPIIKDNKAVGWQARYCGQDGNGTPPAKKIPKYWTAPGFPKSRHLFNYDIANKSELSFGTVVEGVMDVFRFPVSVACFGHKLSIEQRDLLWSAYRNKALVLLLDPDVSETETKALQRELMPCYKNGVANIILPDKKDPSDLNFDQLIDEIYKQSTEQGVFL